MATDVILAERGLIWRRPLGIGERGLKCGSRGASVAQQSPGLLGARTRVHLLEGAQRLLPPWPGIRPLTPRRWAVGDFGGLETLGVSFTFSF